MLDIMKNPSILPNQRGKMQIDTFGNVLMFKNCSAYPHGPAKHKIIEKFLRTLHVFVLHAYPHGPAGQKNELEKRL